MLLKNGLTIMIGASLYLIIHTEFFKPGKGQPFQRVKLKDLLTDSVIERTFHPKDHVEIVTDVEEVQAVYSYQDGNQYIFIEQTHFKQYDVSPEAVKNILKLLEEGDVCTLILHSDIAIRVFLPNFIHRKIISTESESKKNDAVHANTKIGITSTGAKITLPHFIKVGQSIVIDTRTSEYVSRVKDKGEL